VLTPWHHQRVQRHRRRLLIVSGVVAAICAVVALVVVVAASGHKNHSSQAIGTPLGTAGPAGKKDATTVAALLDMSSQARSSVTTTIAGVNSCSIESRQGSAEMGRAIEARRQALARLPNGPGDPVVASLRQALQLSIDADQHFQNWMNFVTVNGCTGAAPHNADYAAANTTSGQATQAKQQFLNAWNPLAQTYGLKQYHENEL
jgi:hypothetical protein